MTRTILKTLLPFTFGKVTTDFNGEYAVANSIAIYVNGNIIAAGKAGKPNYFADYGLARYESEPCLDGYQLKQGENVCIPSTPASDLGDYPDIADRNYVQGNINEDGSRDGDPGYQGAYPTLCRNGQEQGVYNCP